MDNNTNESSNGKQFYKIVNDFIGKVVDEVMKTNNKNKLRDDLIIPFLDIILRELYPYVVTFTIALFILLVLAISSLIFLIILFFRAKNIN